MEKRKLAVACLGIASEVVFKKKKKRSVWSKKWLVNRSLYSDINLLRELRTNEPNDFKNYPRMGADTFYELLALISPYIKKQDTIMREGIPPEERLMVTMRFLATGRSYECLKFSTAISPQAIGRIIPETCKVIYEVLKEQYLKVSTGIEKRIKTVE